MLFVIARRKNFSGKINLALHGFRLEMPIRRFFHRTTIIRRSKKMISIIKKADGGGMYQS